MKNKKDKKKINTKKFIICFLILISIFAISLISKFLQNDTFYTIKIGKDILKYGVDMIDHYSFHETLPYTYPHWLYDVIIYLIYNIGGFTGIYISNMIFFILLIIIVFKTDIRISNSYTISAFATFICALAIAGFVTARAQLVSFLLFALEVCFIEMFLKSGKKKYLGGLLLISLLICNMHVAVWPFYFILYLPSLVEYLVSRLIKKISIKHNNKFVKFLDNKFDLETNENIKLLFITMILSLCTGLLTPIGDTPYTYFIKTALGNSQKYIQEHQMITWMDSPFTIIIAIETIFLACISKVKLRDVFMICGLVLMSVISVRHISLLALIGTICFSRVFTTFLEKFDFDTDKKLIPFFNKTIVIVISSVVVITGSFFLFKDHLKDDYVSKEMYPVDAVKYIKENMDYKNIRIFNGYNYGSYLLLNDIPVFIDSRADLYTKQFSGRSYDIFDDYEFILGNYTEKFEFYNITHVMFYIEKEGYGISLLEKNPDYKEIYRDKYFVIFEKTKSPDFIYSFKDNTVIKATVK